MLSAVIPSRHGYPALPTARQPVHQRPVHPGPLVLGATPLKPPTAAADRDRTVSRRSEPSSRTALTGEQPDPWDLLQPQDAMSRHRGAEPRRRCELLGATSLFTFIPWFPMGVDYTFTQPASTLKQVGGRRLAESMYSLPSASRLQSLRGQRGSTTHNGSLYLISGMI